MAEMDLEGLVGPALAGAIATKGYTSLTPVQEAVLDPALAGRDLRISSQTGSGKTVAIGLTLRDVVAGDVASTPKGVARPKALVVAPTRELAKQVETELSWLFATQRVKVACVTGGGEFRDERRALGAGPAVVVGTPGRLLDHLKRGSIEGTQLGAVVLDEADRMLDLGFRDDLEAILAFAPEGHRTHLVSATFPREVMALANRVQTDPARIEGTPLGTANTDIEHLVHLVLPNERLDAIVNLLLETPDATTLIFARTRADVAELTHLLSDAGFKVDSLSGEMEQRERNKALAAFKRGDLDALVATDVAARGIDVQDIARVLHAEPPSDVDAYTHRSGRTGRAGRQGKSSVLVTPPMLNRVSSLLSRAKVRWRFDPVPTAQSIESAREERLFERLTAVAPPEDPSVEPSGESGPPEADERSWALAKRITEAGEGTRALARMIGRTRAGGPEARRISVINPPQRKTRPWEDRDQGGAPGPGPRRQHEERTNAPGDFARHGRDQREGRAFGESPGSDARGLRPDRSAHGEERFPQREPGPARSPRDAETDAGDWVPFRVSWGQIHGADARRLLAMVCRRGGIRGSDVGAIRVARTFSTIAVSGAVAATFEKATRDPDPRDPRVRIHPADAPPHGAPQGGPSHGGGGRDDAEGDRPSRAAASRTSSADVERASKPNRVKVEADRPSKAALIFEATAAPAAEERPSKRTLVIDRPSKTRRDVEADRPSAPAAATDAERPSRSAAKAKEGAEAEREAPPAERARTEDRPAPRSAHGDRASRPRPSQPERYVSRRPAPAAAPERRTDRGPSDRGDRGPRPGPGGPPYRDRPPAGGGAPYRDRPAGGGAPYRDRPAAGGGAPYRDRPAAGGPPSRDRGPRPDQGGPRPPHPGSRPNGPPSRQGDARPKRKKP